MVTQVQCTNITPTDIILMSTKITTLFIIIRRFGEDNIELHQFHVKMTFIPSLYSESTI